MTLSLARRTFAGCLTVTPIKGRRGDAVADLDGFLCVFDRKGPQPVIGRPLEVMVAGHLPWSANRPMIPALIIRPITEDDFTVEHTGFECGGSSCSTMASPTMESRRMLRFLTNREVTFITPGRSNPIVADNANAGWQGKASVPLTPGRAFINRLDIREGRFRICGLPALDQMSPNVLNHLARRQQPARPAIAV
jgi:hypothetical protein